MAKRRFQIDQLIINSPYEEPSTFCSYDREVRMFERKDGRRPAGYVLATPGSKAFDDPGVFVPLPLVNQIRPRVQAWREAGYAGVSGITKRLLEHWRDPEERKDRRFFFCQLEAIETLVWLTEASPAERQGIDIPSDGGDFTRLCAKMATGSGKTIVMAMLIAWQVLNKVTYPQDKRFSKNIFIVAPGLTVRNRLQVLVPDNPGGDYYDEFNIVPAGMAEKLRQGTIRVRNWHVLNWETEEKIAKKKGVDKRGAKSDEAYVREVLGEMVGARNMIVINDEAHHAWRVPAESKVAGVAKADIDEATRWVGGLDRIHNARGILTCFDFSATPFAPSGKKANEEALFGWIVSDFGLNDAIEDGVVLDLVYEARDIDQHLGSQDKIDAWFEAKTKALNDWQKAELKNKWGTMQKVLGSKSRMDQVVTDVIFDFSVKPRLSSDRGNAILVASSIYEACKYFTLFAKTPFKGKCAVVTSYNSLARDVTLEETGANTETDKQFIYNTYTDLLAGVDAKPGMSKTETYEEWATALFTEEPANMKLLVVVDKLLTGFDAPPCTYLYIDKSMQDHGLFQAICRVNRLDGDDKDFGYIVDYKDLFPKVETAIAVYTSETDHSAEGSDPEVLMQDRLAKGSERLDNALEALDLLCEPVEPPKGELEHIHYFCGNTEIPDDLSEREPQRVALYKATVALVRAYANIADELESAGYSSSDISRIKQQLKHYLDVREIIRKASGETLDLKAYEADMRHLIDTYIEADESREISPFDNMGLLELIVKTGIAAAITSRLGGLKGNTGAIAETIENNVRRKIIKEHLSDPAYYEKMSALLDEIIAARKAKAIEYEEYLKRIAAVAKKVEAGLAEDTPEPLKKSPALRALYNNLKKDGAVGPACENAASGDPTLALALEIDTAVKKERPDGWRGVQAREQVIKAALYEILQEESEVERIFLIIKAQGDY